jgi:N-acetylglucosaminylphosphatidylinositol deacetylase
MMQTLLLCSLLVFSLSASLVLLSYLYLSSYYRSQRCLPWPSTPSLSRSSRGRETPAVGLVIAHPDDESLFFLPSLLHLLSHSVPAFVLCLSNGDVDGRGREREKELHRCLSLLRIPPDRLMLCNDERLRDGLTASWPHAAIHQQLSAFLSSFPITDLLTFDHRGVSSHPNHRSTHAAVSSFLYSRPGLVAAWELVSHSLPVKYSSIIGGALAVRAVAAAVAGTAGGAGGARERDRRHDCIVCVSWRPAVVWRCMAAHTSQFVWYRRLFVVFSMYTYVNVVVRLT